MLALHREVGRAAGADALPNTSVRLVEVSTSDEISKADEVVRASDVFTLRRPLLTAEQVAEWLQIPTAAVYRHSREGRLNFVALGRFRRWDPAVVERFIASGGAGLAIDHE